MNEYTIKEISQRYNLTASTLRYYEDIGLLEDVKHTSSNRRLYNDSHIARLEAIICFKNTGMSLSNIVKFFKYEKNIPKNIDSIINIVQIQEKETMEKIKIFKKELAHIQRKVRYYTGIKEAIKNNKEWPEY
ncbi:MerR family transcriptional regulator [Treponema sp.]|uniref:MerR family transcriptional regulator n=1 Tax=Treponema sp. TaxID=166 RepID=UPI0025D0A820|nr:MerR family transcriptional regulator [Treponema sp.]MCR5217043.1 MerR family transcriptional regulator [Treponema sp.]